jgi:hypothetical protein
MAVPPVCLVPAPVIPWRASSFSARELPAGTLWTGQTSSILTIEAMVVRSG